MAKAVVRKLSQKQIETRVEQINQDLEQIHEKIDLPAQIDRVVSLELKAKEASAEFLSEAKTLRAQIKAVMEEKGIKKLEGKIGTASFQNSTFKKATYKKLRKWFKDVQGLFGASLADTLDDYTDVNISKFIHDHGESAFDMIGTVETKLDYSFVIRKK